MGLQDTKNTVVKQVTTFHFITKIQISFAARSLTKPSAFSPMLYKANLLQQRFPS